MKTLFFAILSGVLVLSLCISLKEEYDGYDYDAENPNALITGENVAGTVFASYPNMVGGRTWIL